MCCHSSASILADPQRLAGHRMDARTGRRSPTSCCSLLRPYASNGNALIALPGPASRSGPWSDGLEGFARTFMLAAFRPAGAGGRDPHGLR